mmetsp:Transcript_37533/g.121305  ORF Transcript_37533/g.121305 Transcript_37533/m.121305 type:complete len:229 (-) Transcript_37533:413-1099(-)
MARARSRLRRGRATRGWWSSSSTRAPRQSPATLLRRTAATATVEVHQLSRRGRRGGARRRLARTCGARRQRCSPRRPASMARPSTGWSRRGPTCGCSSRSLARRRGGMPRRWRYCATRRSERVVRSSAKPPPPFTRARLASGAAGQARSLFRQGTTTRRRSAACRRISWRRRRATCAPSRLGSQRASSLRSTTQNRSRRRWSSCSARGEASRRCGRRGRRGLLRCCSG